MALASRSERRRCRGPLGELGGVADDAESPDDLVPTEQQPARPPQRADEPAHNRIGADPPLQLQPPTRPALVP